MREDALSTNNSFNLDHSEVNGNYSNDKSHLNDSAILKSIVESTSDLIFSVDENYCYTSFNTAHKNQIKQLFNVDIKIGDSFLLPLDDAEKEKAKSNFNKALKEGIFRKVVNTSDKPAQRLFFDVIHSLIKDENEKIIGISVVARDITNQKASYEKVKQLSKAVEQSPVTIVITDTDGKIEYVNQKGIEITGYQIDELIGKNPRVLSTGEKSSEEYKELWDTLISGNTWKGEFHNKKKDGDLYWESATISPIQNESGEIINYLAVKEDITERKIVEKELIEAKNKAEEINKIKNAFLSNMSHELRTPLVGILGFADILENSIEDEELKYMSSSILNSGKRLLNTLTSLLSLSELESIKENIQLEELDINLICEEVYDLFKAHTLNKSIRFNLSLNPEPIKLKINKRLLQESISQLFKNSEKYTDSGFVLLNTYKKAMPPSGTKYGVIEITDTGIGIPEDKMNVVFEDFRQASEGVGRDYEGTGLGLTLTKNYIELMGGKIELQSELNQGTKVSLLFPLVDKSFDEVLDNKKTDFKKDFSTNDETKENQLNILVVENEDINRIFLEKCLSKYSSYCSVANGFDAIKSASLCNYNLVLMDINLGSGIDGIQTTLELRKIPGYLDIPIVAMTAYVDSENIEKYLKNGFTHYISKPFLGDELQELVQQIMFGKYNSK